MWTPWRLALIAGTAAGAATALAQRNWDLISLTTAVVDAGLVCLLTRLGLWASKHPMLPVTPALGVAVANAVIAFLAALPIETHAELMDMPASLEHGAIPMDSASTWSAWRQWWLQL